MARGFESKDVEFQQAEAERVKKVGRSLTAEERDLLERRRTLELALARVKADRDGARSPVHRQMLEAAVADLQAALLRITRNPGFPDAS